FIADTDHATRSWLDKYIHADDRQLVLTAIEEAIRTKGPFRLEHRVLRVDGSLGWTSSRAVPLLDEDGRILEWVGTAADITERRQDITEIEAYDWRIERITLPDGRFGVVCYFYDLSERQRWEAALTASEERLRTSEERLALAVGAAELGTFYCPMPLGD